MKTLNVAELVRVTIALKQRVELYEKHLSEAQKYDMNDNNINYWKEELSILKALLQEFEKHNIVQLQ